VACVDVSVPEVSEPARPGPTAGLRAGRVLWLASLGPALLAVAWVLAAVPLAALGAFHPWLVVPLAVVVAAVLVPCGLSLAGRAEVALRAPWWSVAVTGLVGAAFAVFAALSHSEHTISCRDAGSYAQIAYWLAHHATLTAPLPLGAFGPDPGDIGFASPAFYQHGGQIVPQFMTGWPTLLAGVDWAAGWGGMLVLPAVVGGFAVIAFGGVAARLVGPRWAPVAALLAALAWPVLRVAQETLSEPLALLVLSAGVCLLVDLVGARAAGPAAVGALRRHGFAAGLVLASGELVRLDFGVDFALVLPVVGWLWATRRAGVWPFAVGALLGGLLGAWDGVFVTRPYVVENESSVRLMVLLLGLSAVATAGCAVALRGAGRSLPELRWWRPVPRLGAALVLLVAAGLLVRPYVQVDHSTTDPEVGAYTEVMQGRLGLPKDGTRGYAEQSLWWVSWYLGWPLLAAALAGAVARARGVLRGRDPRWAVALLVYVAGSVLVLVRPGITPDHPWADRRLVVEIVPGMVLFATATIAVAYRWVAARGDRLRALVRPDGRPLRAAGWAALFAVAGLLVTGAVAGPALAATAPVAAHRTEQGELAASADVCALLRPADTVVLIDPLWMPVVRSQCGLPVAQLLHPSPYAVDLVTSSIRAAGRTPVIAGSQLDSPLPLFLHETARVRLDTSTDQQQLVRPPNGTDPLELDFWLVRE
jgi:hypothetical protein